MASTDLIERLRHAGSDVSAPPPEVERIIRRGRRRLATKVVGASLSVALVAAGLGWGLAAFKGLGSHGVNLAPGSITRIDVDGRPIRPVAVGGGAAWFVVNDGDRGHLTLYRIDARTNAVTTIKGIGRPEYVAYGFGSIWVAAWVPPSFGTLRRWSAAVLQLDPANGHRLATVPLGGERLIVSFAVGAGAVWTAVHDRDAATLVRVDPSSRRVVARIKFPGCCGLSLGVGGGGVWALARQVTRVDPTTNRVAATVKVPGADMLGVGSDSVWVNAAHFSEPAPVVRIDPATNQVVEQIQGPGFGYPVVAMGRFWTAIRREDGTIAIENTAPGMGRFVTYPIAPQEGRPRFPIMSFGGPVAILGVGEGAIWTGTDLSGQIIRIQLPESLQGRN